MWSRILRRDAAIWDKARQSAEKGPRVLVATSMGGYFHGSVVESTLAVALTLRGAQVDVLLCDRFLPACQLTKIGSAPPEVLAGAREQPRCAPCLATGRSVFAPLGLPIHQYSDLVTPVLHAEACEVASTLPLEQVSNFSPGGLAVGEHALAGALRYFARGDFDTEPAGEAILRRYLLSSLLSMLAVDELLKRNRYDVACFHHGIYVPQGLVGEVCRKHGVRVVTWNPAYRKHSFIFSHDDSYHRTMLSEPTSEWEAMVWSDALERKTLEYLASRRGGSNDWIWFHERPMEDMDEMARAHGIDLSRPVIGLLTSVVWDAQLHYRSNAFASMLAWLSETIEYFSHRPELQLVIRVHPAEVRGAVPSRQRVADAIRQWFPSLPSNVIVILPEDQASTYALLERCNAALIYNTKTGIEVASMGIPTIVAGEAWIRGKGFSLDAASPAEYFSLLDRLPLDHRLGEDQVSRARKYAYHFFFRRMIPLPFIEPGEADQWHLRISRLPELYPGQYLGLDVICEGILRRAPFVYPAEILHQ